MSDYTPNCPSCGNLPRFRMTRQCFCGNDDCRVLCWDSTVSAEEFFRRAEVVNLGHPFDEHAAKSAALRQEIDDATSRATGHEFPAGDFEQNGEEVRDMLRQAGMQPDDNDERGATAVDHRE